jgi:hypothetical protein
VERSKYPRRSEEKRGLRAGLRGQRTQGRRLSLSLTLGFRRPFQCQARARRREIRRAGNVLVHLPDKPFASA